MLFFRQKTAEGDYVCIYVSAEGEPEASKQVKEKNTAISTWDSASLLCFIHMFDD